MNELFVFSQKDTKFIHISYRRFDPHFSEIIFTNMNLRLAAIVAKLDQIAERQDPQQKSVHQLPALFKPKNISPVLGSKKDPANPFKGYFVGGESQEHATEDVVSSVKKKLGDYLQDVATAIKKDPTLIDKVSQEDFVGPAVKTITTDDGHEIKIHGNEDDGFRISIKNRPSKSKFENLAHAEMACEMFCNRRRQAAESADYIEERT
jgi:hypothetical protein